MSEDKTRLLLNRVLKEMYPQVMRLQEKMVSLSADANLSRTEMHALEIIHELPGATLTQIAEALEVTKATASVSVNRLVKKGYLEKHQLPFDKRKSELSLTPSGEECCKKHRDFHDKMIDSILSEFKVSEHPELLRSMSALVEFFAALNKSGL